MPVLELKVNGTSHTVKAGHRETLLEVLRNRLFITSPKVGCNTGECGACSVILEGKLVKSCLVLAQTAQGKEVITLEGLSEPADLHPLQKAFYTHYGAQCGFCTPGMIVAAKAFLDKNPNPTRQEVKEALSGNLCRCTGYVKIVNTVMAAAQEMAGQSANPEERGGSTC